MYLFNLVSNGKLEVLIAGYLREISDGKFYDRYIEEMVRFMFRNYRTRVYQTRITDYWVMKKGSSNRKRNLPTIRKILSGYPMVFSESECKKKRASLTKFADGVMENPLFDPVIFTFISDYAECLICLKCNIISMDSLCSECNHFVCGDYKDFPLNSCEDSESSALPLTRHSVTFRKCDIPRIYFCDQQCGFWFPACCYDRDDIFTVCFECEKSFCLDCFYVCFKCFLCEKNYCTPCFRKLRNEKKIRLRADGFQFLDYCCYCMSKFSYRSVPKLTL